LYRRPVIHFLKLITFVLALLKLSVFPSRSQEIILIPNSDRYLHRSGIVRRDLAHIFVSYCPRNILTKLSKGVTVPDPETDEPEIWKFLNTTGILPAFSDGLNHPFDEVTRSNLAIILQKVTGLLACRREVGEALLSPTDLDTSRYDRLPIQTVLTIGLMDTDSLGKFRPDEIVSGPEAVRAVTSLSNCLTANGKPRDQKTP